MSPTGSGIQEWLSWRFWPRVSPKVAIDVGWSCNYLKVWPGLESLFRRWLTQMAGKSMLVVGGKPQFLPTWAPDRVAWVSSRRGGWLPPEQGVPEKQSGNCSDFHDIVSSHSLHLCCWLLVSDVRVVRCRSGPHGAWISGSENLEESAWRLATAVPPIPSDSFSSHKQNVLTPSQSPRRSHPSTSVNPKSRLSSYKSRCWCGLTGVVPQILKDKSSIIGRPGDKPSVPSSTPITQWWRKPGKL